MYVYFRKYRTHAHIVSTLQCIYLIWRLQCFFTEIDVRSSIVYSSYFEKIPPVPMRDKYSIADLNKITRTTVVAKKAHELINKNGFKFKYGRFSDIELATIKTTVNAFLKHNSKTEADLQYYFMDRSTSDFPIKELLGDIVDVLKIRTYRFIYQSMETLYHPFSTNQAFSEEDDKRLMELVEKHGHCWKDFEYELVKQRDAMRIRYRTLVGNSKSINYEGLRTIVKRHIVDGNCDTEMLSKQYGVSQAFLIKRINAYLKGKEFDCQRNNFDGSKMCIAILAFNHFCGFEFSIEKVFGLLDTVNELNALFVDENHGDSAMKDTADENLFEIEPGYQCRHPKEMGLDEFKGFTTRVIQLLEPSRGMDLSVEVDIGDIFIYNISQLFKLEFEAVKAKVYILKSTHAWSTFGDVLETTRRLTEEFLRNTYKDFSCRQHIDKLKRTIECKT